MWLAQHSEAAERSLLKVSRGQAVAVSQMKMAKTYSGHTEINGCLLVLAFAAGSPVDIQRLNCTIVFVDQYICLRHHVCTVYV